MTNRRHFLTVAGAAIAGIHGPRVAGRRSATVGQATQPAGDVVWQRTYAGTERSRAYDVVATDGGYLFGGFTGYTGEYDADPWLVAVDENGNRQYERTYEMDDRGTILALTRVSDGGYILAGRAGLTATDNPEAWLIRVDESGERQWERWYGEARRFGARDVIETGDGEFLFAGDDTAESGSARLVRVDESGDVVWEQTYRGENRSAARSVIETVDGYVFGGYTAFTGQYDANAWLVAVDEDGDVRWRETYGTPDDDGIYDVIRTDDGFLFAGSVGVSPTQAGSAWLVAVDANGQRHWERRFDAADGIGARDLVPVDDGYLVAGYDSETNGGDARLVRFDDAGRIQWRATYGTDDLDSGLSVIAGADGDYILAGESGVTGVKTDEPGGVGASDGDALLVKVKVEGTPPQSTTPTSTPVATQTPTDSPTPTLTPTATRTPDPTSTATGTPEATPTATTSNDGPGFGLWATLFGLAGGLLFGRSRRTDD